MRNACRKTYAWVNLYYLNTKHFKATSTGISTLQKDQKIFLPTHFGTKTHDAFQENNCNSSIHTHLLSIQ